MKYINLIIILLIGIITSFFMKEEYLNYNYNTDTSLISYVPEIKAQETKSSELPIETFYGTVTAYGPDCDGCIGITASGYDVRNTIYYEDEEYGRIRIIAADKSIPFGTIIKLNNINENEELITIVLDRGGAIGFNTNAQADLLFEDEESSYTFGRQFEIKFEVLRLGF